MSTEVRECVCGCLFEVLVEFAKPWTVCPDCMKCGVSAGGTRD